VGSFRIAIAAVSLAATLAACGSEAAAPNPVPDTPNSPKPSDGGVDPPAVPIAASKHTAAGARAFVTYYWNVVNYAQRTLNVTLLRQLSLPTCTGCRGGIKALTDIASHNDQLIGGDNTVRVSGTGSFAAGRPFTLAITVTNTPQKIVTPGKKTVLHPAGTTRMIITLVPTHTMWRVGELREQ
jgi:hypothetical protein